jgi:hypothetical protein
MAEAKFSIGQVNITGYLRVIAREMTDTGPSPAESANVVYAPPQPTTRNIVIADLNPIPYQFEFYESDDGIALGVLLASYVIDVGKIFQAIMTLYEFKVGRGEANDPAANATQYTNSALAGFTAERLIVTQRVVGPRSFLMGEIEVLDAGGFKFPDDSDEVFNDQDFWTVWALNLITVQDPVNITRGRFKDIIEFDDDLTITDDHYDCLLEAAGPDTDLLTLTFPPLAGIPNDVAFGITTHGGDQRYVAIQLDGSDICRFMRDTKNIFWLGKNETIYVIIKDGIMKVSDYNGDYARVGQKVKRDIDFTTDPGDESPLNIVAEVGGWLLIADYPRLYYEFVNKLPPAQLSAVVAGVVTDKTKFAIDAPNVRFWIPDTGGYVERNVDPDANVDTDRASDQRYTGTVQTDLVGDIDATLPVETAAVSGGNGGTPNMKVIETDIVAPFKGPDDTVELTIAGGSETRMKNVAVNSWRII